MCSHKKKKNFFYPNGMLSVFMLSVALPSVMAPFFSLKQRVRVKQRTYFLLVSTTEMAIWQAILT